MEGEDPEDPILTPACRICFEEHKPLLLPCSCTQPVHLECLNKWRYQFPLEHDKRLKCEVCLAPYKLPDYDKYRVIGLFWFWSLLSISGLVLLPMLKNQFQLFFAGMLLLCCFVASHYYLQRIRNEPRNPAMFVNIMMLLFGGLVILYIMQMPNNNTTVLLYIYTVFGTYVIVQAVILVCRRLNG